MTTVLLNTIDVIPRGTPGITVEELVFRYREAHFFLVMLDTIMRDPFVYFLQFEVPMTNAMGNAHRMAMIPMPFTREIMHSLLT